MKKRAPQLAISGSSANVIPVAELLCHAQDWLFEAECRQHTKRTVAAKKEIVDKLIWFLHHKNFTVCGISELRQFFAYLRNGHEEGSGRWGNPQMVAPMRPCTVATYYAYLQGMFSWFVSEEIIDSSPFERIARPNQPHEQVTPFTQEQIQSLLSAARRSTLPRRNEAIILFLLDTGVRATELCSLKMCDLDMAGRTCTVLGKGNKYRQIYFGRATGRTLSQYLREKDRNEDHPVFVAERGRNFDEALTRSGLLQLINNLGEAARLKNVRCSPHTFRHTFAIEFLRNGGNVFSLQQLLGHTGLSMTQKYVAMAQGDIENQHRAYSPADRMRNKVGVG